MLQLRKMAGHWVTTIFTFVLILFGVSPSLSKNASFKQQEDYVGAVGRKGRDVELQFRGNECLHKVLNELVLTCKDGQHIADQKLRNLLAFNIMNCYANFTFKQDFPCSSDNVSACMDLFVKRHGEEVQEMYKHLERLIQVDNLCVAVQQEQWQAEMDHLLERLLQSSAVAVDKLAEAVSRQMQLNQQQRNAEKNQEKILHTGHKTQATLGSSHQEMNESFSSVFAFIHEQQQLITEMFGGFNLVTDSLAFILSILQGKVSFLHALIFFVFAVYLVYEVTASKLTRRGRPWLYVVCTSNFLLEAVTVMYQQISGSDGFSFWWQRYYAMLVGGAVLGIAVIQQVRKKSLQSSRQLFLLSNKLDDISKRVSTSPVHQQTSTGPCLSPIMVQESSGAGRLPVDEPDYAPQQDATATTSATAVRNLEVLLQEEAVCQESYASVIAEEEWSNVGFNVSKADERHGEEKGEQEIRGEKESREVPKARGRPPKTSHAMQQSLTKREEEGVALSTPMRRYNLRRRTLGATPLH